MVATASSRSRAASTARCATTGHDDDAATIASTASRSTRPSGRSAPITTASAPSSRTRAIDAHIARTSATS
jgi:hypothetical protein